MPSLFTSILLAVFSLFALTTADSTNDTIPSATFVYSGDGGDFVFALNVDKTTSDLYFHMSAPNGNEWMGVGIGTEMKGSLVFIAYASKNGSGITLSPRVATGETEPSYTDKVDCSLVYGDDYKNEVESGTDGLMIVNAKCSNATSWKGGSLDIDDASTAQPFIFAVGPGSTGGSPGTKSTGGLTSNSKSAGLREHDFYGTFTMDLTAAISSDSTTAGVPLANSDNSTYVISDATLETAQGDNDPAPVIHGLIMCFTFVILFPVGSLVLRALNKVKAHAIVQSVGMFLVCCATAGGIKVSLLYNRSKHFASAHQIIGILLFLALLSQLGLGIIHHRIFKKKQRPTIMGKIHKYLGPTTIAFGVINAPIGFVFAGNPHLCLPYTVILLLMVIVYCTIRFWSMLCCRDRRQRNKLQQQNVRNDLPPQGAGPEGYQQPQFGPGSYMQPPPAYGRQPYERQPSYGPGEDVPLRPYESQQSGINAPPAYPRPMI